MFSNEILLVFDQNSAYFNKLEILYRIEVNELTKINIISNKYL
jgi:hypothetical protein